jgi:hypothetical protein
MTNSSCKILPKFEYFIFDVRNVKIEIKRLVNFKQILGEHSSSGHVEIRNLNKRELEFRSARWHSEKVGPIKVNGSNNNAWVEFYHMVERGKTTFSYEEKKFLEQEVDNIKLISISDKPIIVSPYTPPKLSRKAEVDKFITVRGHGLWRTCASKKSNEKMLTHMTKDDKYLSIYQHQIRECKKALRGERSRGFNFSTATSPEEYLRFPNRCPIGTYRVNYPSRHPLVSSIRKALANNLSDTYFDRDRVDVSVSFETSNRYEDNFAGNTREDFHVKFKSLSLYRQFIEDFGLKPNFYQSGTVIPYINLYWDMPTIVPDEIVTRILERREYLKNPNNWGIFKAGVSTNYGEQLHTGVSRTSHHSMVRWETNDRKSYGSEDSFWEPSYIEENKPWEGYDYEHKYLAAQYGMPMSELYQVVRYNYLTGIDFSR